MCCIGFAINISDVSIGVKYFGTFFCVAGSYAAFPGVVAWYVHCGIAVTIREKDVMMTPSIQPGLEIISQANTNVVWEWPCTLGLGTSEERLPATSIALKTLPATS